MWCDVSINRCDVSKRLEVIAYKDNQSFDYAAHSMLVDIVVIREIVKENEINPEKQMGDILTKSGASSKILWDVSSSSKIIDL